MGIEKYYKKVNPPEKLRILVAANVMVAFFIIYVDFSRNNIITNFILYVSAIWQLFVSYVIYKNYPLGKKEELDIDLMEKPEGQWDKKDGI